MNILVNDKIQLILTPFLHLLEKLSSFLHQYTIVPAVLLLIFVLDIDHKTPHKWKSPTGLRMKTRGVVGSVTIIVQFQIRLSRILSPKSRLIHPAPLFSFPASCPLFSYISKIFLLQPAVLSLLFCNLMNFQKCSLII